MSTSTASTVFVGMGTVVAAAAVLLVIAFGVVLAYHWYRFAADASMATFATALYAVGSVLILALLFAALPGLLL